MKDTIIPNGQVYFVPVGTPIGDTWSGEPDDVLNRAMTLLRFATLPHYDEKETP